MKYSIIISPNHKNSNACDYASGFIQSAIEQNHEIISVFFYGYAVRLAFEKNPVWEDLANNSIPLFACSTIAENYISKKKEPVSYFHLAGLGQWLESVENADKNIEFV